MDIAEPGFVIVSVTDAVICVPTLPDGTDALGDSPEVVREASFDQLHGSFEREFRGRYQQVHVIGHDDESMQLVEIAVFEEDVDEQLGVSRDLEDGVTLPADGSDKEGSGNRSSLGRGHVGILSSRLRYTRDSEHALRG